MGVNEIVCLICMCMLGLTQSARILLLPFPFPSHVSMLVNIGKALRENGHEMYIGISEKYPSLESLQNADIPVITHRNEKPDFYEIYNDEEQDKYLEESFENVCIVEFRLNLPGSIEICTNMLSDAEFHQKLKKLDFDLVIVDAFQASRCFYIVPYMLDVPWVSVYTLIEPWLSRNPALPSFTPSSIGKPYTEKMTFWERIDNLLWTVDFTVMPRMYELDDNLVETYAKGKPFVTLNYLAGKSLLWLIDLDVVMDYARPVMPNEIMIGGLTTKPANPLPDNLEKFVSSAPDGVIIVSFGSISANLPAHVQKVMFNVFSRLEQHVVWRFAHSVPTDIPKNVKIMTWLPQNDVLGHKNTRLFITHCGANGQHEALYHGVPMIGLPMFGDQPYNAKRMHYHGYGIHMSLLNLTEEGLLSSIKEILYNPSYKQKIAKASGIYRSRPMTTRQRAVYWIEHVLKFGGQHLRSYALDMPWYQYLMLDIFVFLLLIAICLTISIICVCKKLCFTNTKLKMS